MLFRLVSVLSLAVLFGIDGVAQRLETSPLDEAYSSLEWRCIGPYRGGRANAISGVIGSPQRYYAGYTGGGVWKTEDAGLNWQNLSDGYFPVGSIGDIAVSESDPNVVYVGTGEHAVRGVMTSFGNGIYKSTDAGDTWTHLGLEGTKHIANVVVHPTDDNVVYVAAQGAVHGPTPDRGVYKSTDGGVTWRRTLFVNENTGASSLVMDMTNPRILYAATWEHQRYPWKVVSGGPGSAIFKSTDAGETWHKLSDGLPTMMGKVGLSVSRANPDRVFAIIETTKAEAGLYRSDDGGASWSLTCNDQIITARSWYYMECFADPTNENVVYVLNAPLMKSIDGGKTFQSMRVIHGDCHGFWINPKDGKNFAMAEDGGATISFNAGQSWSSLNNQPTSQFYRVTADHQTPFWLYGGQQDNMSVCIPSRSKNYGILSTDWFNGPGCESAMVAFDDPYNPRIIFGGCFNGRISLLDIQTMESKDIMAYPETNLGYAPKEMKYRFNWNAPLINSPHDASVMYYGGNVLFKSTNGGLEWVPISQDLTRDDTTKQGRGGEPFTNEGAGGENYNTIYYIAESPHEEGLIYTGSDCGLMHITRDGGQTWHDITPPNMPESMIHAIEVSPHNAGTVYFASTRYKLNDFANYSYKSTDYGKTWTRIGEDIQEDDFFRVIREDTRVPGILYAGAERGFYISFDAGVTFERMQLNLPIVPITDLAIRDNSLAAATAGRSFWILDDLSPLQQSKGVFGTEPLLYTPKDHARVFGGPPFFLVTEYAYGKNPSEGVTIDYYLPSLEEDDEPTLEIMDEFGTVVRTIKGTAEEITPKMLGTRGNVPGPSYGQPTEKEGLNRFVWDMRTDSLVKIPNQFVLNADYRGHRVAPGSYSIRLTYGDHIQEAQFQLEDPPGVDVPDEVWREQQQLMSLIEAKLNAMHEDINQTVDIRDRLEIIRSTLKGQDELQALDKMAAALDEKLDAWQSVVIEFKQKGFQDAINWRAGINSEYFMLRNNLDTYDPAIPAGYKTRFMDLNATWATHERLLAKIIEEDIAQFNQAFEESNLPTLPVPKSGKP